MNIVPITAICLLLAATACSDDDGSGAGSDMAADGSADRSRDLPGDSAGDAQEDPGASDQGGDGPAQDTAADALSDTPSGGDPQDEEGTADDAARFDADLAVADADGSASVDQAAACAEEIATLTAELYARIQGCAVAVRLDYTTRALLGYQVFCGSYASVDEETARATAQTDTGYGTGIAMLNAENPEDHYAFHQSSGDFGGASAVSASTGLTTFGGSIVWDGAGDITYPATWRVAAELGQGCPPSGGISTTAGWDLRSGTALGSEDVEAAVDVVRQTAVPAAMWQGGYVFNAVVLLYPRSVGVFNPDTAEWVVLVNGGWLE